jgi:hypothetical protein
MSTSLCKPADTALLNAIAEDLRVEYNLRSFFDIHDGDCKARRVALQKAQELTPQELGQVIAADPEGHERSPQLKWVNEWLCQASTAAETQQRLAALVIFGQISVICAELPIFDHNCKQCVYLGAKHRVESKMISAPMVYPRAVDLYMCRVHAELIFVVRYGKATGEYIDSRETLGLTQKEPHLGEAFSRAFNRGLLMS